MTLTPPRIEWLTFSFLDMQMDFLILIGVIFYVGRIIFHITSQKKKLTRLSLYGYVCICIDLELSGSDTSNSWYVCDVRQFKSFICKILFHIQEESTTGVDLFNNYSWQIEKKMVYVLLLVFNSCFFMLWIKKNEAIRLIE